MSSIIQCFVRLFAFLFRLLFPKVHGLAPNPTPNPIARNSSPTPPPPNSANVNNPSANLPPFNGSPEEALLLFQLPPIGKAKQRVITRIDPSGSIPDLVEEWRLTSMGKVLSRTDFMVMDDNFSIGPVQNLQGKCTFCHKIVFAGKECECGFFFCKGCIKQFEAGGKVQFLCPTCYLAAEWNRNNWAKPETKSPSRSEFQNESET